MASSLFQSLKLYKIPLLLFLTTAAFYWSFAYDLDRADFPKLITLYAGLFFLSFKIIQLLKTRFWFLAGAALIFRLFFIFALPNLSQDFYRFIWDGRLLANGINPYLSTPDYLIESAHFGSISQAQQLVNGMGTLSASNYTNYPPINQLIFAVSGWFSDKNILFSVVIFRLFILLAEIGILFYGRKLLQKLDLPEYYIFWFILNPFVIIECFGNLHFESVMGFFILLSFYFLWKRKWIISAIILGLSISVKLLPLMFLPLFLKFFSSKKSDAEFIENRNLATPFSEKITELKSIKWTKLLGFYAIVLLTVILSFLPFYNSAFLNNFSESVGLWFQKFEFNASIYYIVRWIGFQIKGYNIIADAGRILPVITFIIILAIGLFRKNSSLKSLISGCVFALAFYFLLSTTVHPWYIVTPLLLSVFTKYRFPIVWSFMAILSYSAYGNAEFQENLWLVALEYLVVIGFAITEVFFPKKLSFSLLS
ncbi:glycosyltransferase 87 family protein [Zunongwangia sp. HGR-M22]|uniref:glycosyltransferase 87 family protein n=1 Tax=Zunongwangia sp. HGR-M22 TaxID=3015168 RepID=UPI0022DDFCF1|nr:glycosyltransferase 87 family protein [Zunongwangia sp. HGR-M22]WBL25247.1 glycosyltransferase 87 family protein [Zunongwangia sp. HGR-M22]